MKTLGIILGLGISIFMGISIYNYNYGDGNDWIHVLDKGDGGTVRNLHLTPPDGVPKVYVNGDSVKWNPLRHYAWVNGNVDIEYAEGDSSKAVSILEWHYYKDLPVGAKLVGSISTKE